METCQICNKPIDETEQTCRASGGPLVHQSCCERCKEQIEYMQRIAFLYGKPGASTG